VKRISWYPRVLVALQFGIIAALIFFSIIAFRPALSGAVLIFVGLGIGLAAIRAHRYVQAHNFRILPELQEGCELVTHGIYRYIRHPMYTSVMVMMLGVALMTSYRTVALALWGVLCAVLVLKALREEKLWCGHDARYDTYKRKVKRFVPFIV